MDILEQKDKFLEKYNLLKTEPGTNRNEKGEVTTDNAKIQRIISDL